MAAWDTFFLTSTSQPLPEGLGYGNKSLVCAWKGGPTLPEYLYMNFTVTRASGETSTSSILYNTILGHARWTVFPGVWGSVTTPGSLDGTSTLNKIEFIDLYGSVIDVPNVLGLFLPSHYSQVPFGATAIYPVESGVGNIPVGVSFRYPFPQMVAGDLVISAFHATGLRNGVTPAEFTPANPNSHFTRHEYIAPNNTSTAGWSLGISAMPLQDDPRLGSDATDVYLNDWQTDNTFTRSVSKDSRMIYRDPRLWEHSEVITTGTRRLNLLGEWDGSAVQPVTPEIT